jgi:glycosyltransferase involved in cell wall biosynthesis
MEFVDSLIFPIYFFPFSVDVNQFTPSNQIDKKIDCIVYIKRRLNSDIQYLTEQLTNKNITYKIFKYGSYNEQEYINALHECKFMISLDAHESQGFALEEAMSCNIPLLVIDAKTMYDECDDGYNPTYKNLHPKKMLATSVPYWSDNCGIKIYDQDKISNAIDIMMDNYKNFSPRDYIMNTLSDKVCMERILNYFTIFN